MQNIWMIIVFLSAGIIGFWCMKKIDSLFEKIRRNICESGKQKICSQKKVRQRAGAGKRMGGEKYFSLP